MNGFFKGVGEYLKVMGIARQYGLWKYLIWSGLCSLLIAVAIFYVAYLFGDNLGAGLFSWYKWEVGSGIIAKIEAWVGGLLIGIIALLLYKYIVLIIASPFMSFLSEQLERSRSNYPQHNSFSWSQAIHDLRRGLALNLRNLIRELVITLLLLFVGLIPLVTVVIPFAIFIVQAYYAGFGNLDYLLERHHDVKGSINFVRKNKGLAIGNGTVFLLLLMIPVLGWFVAPFFATIASTSAALDKMEIHA